MPPPVDGKKELEEILQDCIKGGPIVLVVDELGNFLMLCRNNLDVFVLQRLAEFANRSENQFVFLGLLHQAFSQYASGVSAVAESEWAKVQGRFMDIPFNLSLEEQVQLRVGLQDRTTTWQDNFSKTKFAKFTATIKNVVLAFEGKINDLHPLCPMTAVLVGAVSRQAFSQNQRSLFSFLSSNEPFSFRRLLMMKEKRGNIVF